MGRNLRLGRILGIPITADVSVLVLAVILVVSLFVDLRRVRPAASPELLLAAAAIGGALFLASVLAHELSHSVLAVRRGLAVRRIRLFVFGGVSEIEHEAENPWDEFAIAVAGPVTSAALGAVLLGASYLLPGSWELLGRLATILGIVNLTLAVFNLLPGFPLDGGRALRALLWRAWDRRRATRVAVEAGRALALVLIGVGAWLVVGPRNLAGLWTIAVGWFLYQAAVGSAARERLLALIEGLTVADVMRPLHESAPGETTVALTLAHHQVGAELLPVPVVVEGRVRGLVGQREIARLDPGSHAGTRLVDVMTPVGPRDVVDASEPLDRFLASRESVLQRALVLRDGRVVGIVSDRELSNLLSGV